MKKKKAHRVLRHTFFVCVFFLVLKKLGIKNKLSTLALRFKGVIKRAYEQTGQMVAILVDEYDKPMLQAIVKI